MKKRIGILVMVAALLLCAHALGSETVYETLGECRIEALTEGFAVPVPTDSGRFSTERKSDHYLSCRSTDGSAPNSLYLDAYVFDPLDEFAEREEIAEKVYKAQHYETNEEYKEETVRVGGHPARICVFRGKADSGDYSVGILHYVRNNRMLQIRLYSEPLNGTAWEDLPRITTADMYKLAQQIVYDPNLASVTEDDGSFILKAEEGPGYVAAGKTLKIIPSFENPDKMSRLSWNHAFKWTVKDDETGKKPKGVTVNKNGEIAADAQIRNTMNVTVTAESTVFHTTASIKVLIVPAVKRLSMVPANLSIYTSTKEPVIVQAVPEPSIIPATGYTWAAGKQGIVEIIPNEANGTAGILPLKAGRTMISAREPGGKIAKLNVTVMTAVEDIELSVRGNPVPYGIVTVKETLLPKQADNRTVTWSLDVGPEIATIKRGQITIGKKAQPGTIITVTCTAVGAPEPVVRTVEIEVKGR